MKNLTCLRPIRRTFQASAYLFALLLSISLPAIPVSLRAELSSLHLGNTQASTLNDLIRRVPIQSRMRERELAGLSAVQEQAILHERRMRGDGLPSALQQHFAANYSAILTAIVDEKIDRPLGRGLLDAHRQLLDDASYWACLAVPDPAYGENLAESLLEQRAILEQRSIHFCELAHAARTPLINGHRLWVEELLIWGGQCRFISYGELGKIALMAKRLERFEGYYKRDGFLNDRERYLLHERLIEIQRATVDAFAS